MRDELERIKEFRADEPPATPAAVESARRELMAAIAGGADPRLAAGSAAGSAVESPSRPPAGREGRSARRGRYRPRLVAGLAAACVAAAVVVLVLGTGSTSPPGAVAAMLERLAKLAEAQSPVNAPRAGQYLYVDSLQANNVFTDAGSGRECTTLVPEHRQIWIRADGAGRLLESTGQATPVSPHDRTTCRQIHAVSPPGVSDTWFAPRCLELGLASRLPRSGFQDPAVLLREMRAIDGGPPGPGEDFVHVGDFLRESDDSPALRGAIYRAAATIRGVRLLGPTTDHLGRRGVGIGYPGHGVMSELILSERTSALLGEQTVDLRTGQALDWAAYRTSRIVDRIPGPSPGPLGPACVNGGGYNHTVAGGASIVNAAPITR
jgi:hypothetical protein